MPAGFLTTIDALEALQAKLQKLQYNGKPMFATVALFDMSNLATAFQEILAAGDRVCFIVHDNEHFHNERAGRELRTRQMREITLLIADRHVGSRQKAMFGDSTLNPPTPGVFNLKDSVLNGIIGLLQPGLFVQPAHGEQMVIEKKIRDELQGRAAFMFGIDLVGGNVITDLGQYPIP